MTYRSNMHMVSKVIEVTGFKSGAIFIALMPADLWGHCPLVDYSDEHRFGNRKRIEAREWYDGITVCTSSPPSVRNRLLHPIRHV